MKLEKFNYNSGKRSKWFLYGFIMCAVLMVLINLFFSHAKYLNKESVKIAEGTIKNYSPYDFKLLAVKLENDRGEYESTNTVPDSGYVLNKAESYCTIPDGNGNNVKDSSITINYHNGVVDFANINTQNTKCYLYFDVKTITMQDILATKVISTRTDFSTILSTDTTGTIYTAPDDYGTSYYFAGNPTDNWVKFAGFYWRIIRINGDGTIRMIYQGDSANAIGGGTQIGTSAFNSSYNDNMYVGYMYTSGQLHGRKEVSTIKGVLDIWYNNNLASYAGKIATGGGATFCNDRTSHSGSGIGTNSTDYASYNRLANNRAPTFKCADSGDRFDTSIGLITADEISYAGGAYNTQNSNYYLYTAQYYWTMSPYNFNYGNAYVLVMYSGGSLDYNFVGWPEPGVRPVINLKADTKFVDGGTGTIDNPYIVS